MSTLSSLKKLAPNAKVDLAAIAAAFDKYSAVYGVTTPARVQAFWAQAAHETDGFRTLREYASGAAYEGRKDLGNTQPGDGVRFRGRGIFQITGRANTKATSTALYGDDRLLSNPELLEQPEPAVRSALNYWKTRGLNQYADVGDFKTITQKINGGLNGWADRLNYFEKAKILFLTAP